MLNHNQIIPWQFCHWCLWKESLRSLTTMGLLLECHSPTHNSLQSCLFKNGSRPSVPLPTFYTTDVIQGKGKERYNFCNNDVTLQLLSIIQCTWATGKKCMSEEHGTHFGLEIKFTTSLWWPNALSTEPFSFWNLWRRHIPIDSVAGLYSWNGIYYYYHINSFISAFFPFYLSYILNETKNHLDYYSKFIEFIRLQRGLIFTHVLLILLRYYINRKMRCLMFSVSLYWQF